MPRVCSRRLIDRSTYSIWRCASQQRARHPLYQYPQLNGTYYSGQYRSIHLSQSQRGCSQSVELEQFGQERLAVAEVTNPRRWGSFKRRQRTGGTGKLIPCVGVGSLNNIDEKRHRLSWMERRILRRREHKSQNSSTVWKIWKPKSSSVAPQPLRRFRPIESRIHALVGQGLSRWYPETAHIYEVITQNSLQSTTDVPKDLLAFGKYVQNGAVYQAWLKRSWRGKAIWWRHSLYYAFLFSPSDALQIVADISKRTYLQIPGRTMSDALLILDACYVVNKVYEEPIYNKVVLFNEAVCTYLKNYTKREGRAFLSWCIIRRLSRVLQANHLTSLTRSVILSKTEYLIYTKLQAMFRYIRLNLLGHALELFKTFTEEELLNRAAYAFCITVLRKEWQSDDFHAFRQELKVFSRRAQTNNLHTFRQELKVVSKRVQTDDLHTFRRAITVWFLRQGVVPNCMLRNVIIQNYLESGDRESAFSMLDSIRERGLETSEYTYAIFLRHVTMEDLSTVKRLHDMAVEDRVLPRSAFLAEYFIQIAALVRFASGRNSFSALLALYEASFDTTDLESFGILEAPSVKTNLRGMPSTFALRWMLVSWIDENKDTPERIVSAYNNYQFHLRNNHPRIAKLASITEVPTAFILAFGQHKSHLHMCTKVVQDMLQPEKTTMPPDAKMFDNDLDDPDVPAHEKFLEPETPSHAKHTPLPFNTPVYRDWDIWQSLTREPFSYKVAPPEAKTWNALLTVLLQHNHFNAAEGVLKAMQQAGFEANKTTWKILIRGFADRHQSLQDVPEELRNNSSIPEYENTDDLSWRAANSTVSDDSRPGSGTRREIPDATEDDTGTPSLQGAEAEKPNGWDPDSVYGEMMTRV